MQFCFILTMENIIIMEEFKKVIFTYALLIALGGNQLCCQVALHYLRSKPLGLQTFFDLALKDFFGIFAIFSFHHVTFILIGLWIHNDLHWILVEFTTLSTIFLFAMVQFYATVTIFTKYLSIFHSEIINGIKDEAKILKRIRIGVFSASTFYLILTYHGIDFQQTFFYKNLTQDLPHENTTAVPWQFKILQLFNMILAIVLQLRKELDYWRYRENSGILSEIQNSRKKPERLFLVVAITFIIASFLLVPNLFNHRVLKAILQMLLFQTLFFMGPLAYILSSKGMARCLVKILGLWFPLFRNQNDPIYHVLC